MSRIPIPTTPYTVGPVAIFASTRWRFEIYGSGNALVTVSAATFATAEQAVEAGKDYARAMARQIRRDLG